MIMQKITLISRIVSRSFSQVNPLTDMVYRDADKTSKTTAASRGRANDWPDHKCHHTRLDKPQRPNQPARESKLLAEGCLSFRYRDHIFLRSFFEKNRTALSIGCGGATLTPPSVLASTDCLVQADLMVV
jgi:hypothetical protein